MSARNKYALVGFLHPIGHGQAFLTPLVLRNEQFWIQDISDDDRIVGFRRTLLSGYVFPYRGDETLQTGVKAIFAFYTGNGTVLSGTKSELTARLETWSQSASTSNAIAASVAEFTGDSQFLAKSLSVRNQKLQAQATSIAEPTSIANITTLVKSFPDLFAQQARLYEASIQGLAQIANNGELTTAQFYAGFEAVVDTQRKFLEGFTRIESVQPRKYTDAESAVAVMKSAVAAANNALESVQKSVKQATEVAEANFAAATINANNARQVEK